jgi:carbamoyltransferase
VQARTEEIFGHVLQHAATVDGARNLCLAGGCAYNSVANGRIVGLTPFEQIFVPPAAGDAGTAVGAALWVWHQVLGRPREFRLDHAALGPAYSDPAMRRALEAAGQPYEWIVDDEALVDRVVERLVEGDAVGWFQGREEWGPRALGNRSILADPRPPGMKDRLNQRIKRRESFRPFAPALPRERAADYFERWQPAPFMTQAYPVRPHRRAEVPAVTHVDGTARVQTVDRESHPLFHRLLSRFGERTGTPVLLNTSFNESEPIVHTPEQAAACFARTEMDVLVLGRAMVIRRRE